MIKNLIKQGVIVTISMLCSFGVSAQTVKHERLLSFEEISMPNFISSQNSKLSLSPKHHKDGTQALRWSFEPNAMISIKKDISFEPKDPTGKDLYLSTFVVWVYNELPQDKSIEFQFLKDGSKCTSFPFKINFKGWRAAWVCFERDMEGTPQEGMNELRIVAPNMKGELYIDHLLTAAKTDHRHQTADVQVPFVNKQTKSHWLVLHKHSLLKPDIALTPVSSQQKQEMKLIEKRLRNHFYTPSKLSDKTLHTLRKKYARYNISYKEGQVSGLPIFFARAAEAYERLMPQWDKNFLVKQGVEVKAYFDLMNQVAIAYNNATLPAQKGELKEMFLSMYRHITDQGVAYGSCWGNFTHYGYSFRNLYSSYFLMKDVIIESGELNNAERTLQWYAITNEVYDKPTAWGLDMDAFNTVATGRITSILMMEDTPEKLQYLKSFTRWIDNGCLPALGLAGAFKKDGGAFHHRNNYPAYAVGGLDGATRMVYLLSRTGFSVSPLAHQTVKNVLLAMRFYCNKENFPLAMSGRHPDGKGKLIPMQYGVMAMAGTPDGKAAFDSDMAAAYLRLVSNDSSKKEAEEYMPRISKSEEVRMAKRLIKEGFTPEPDPQGNLSLGYGCVSVQRRNNWSAVVRGHSRYLWAAEHYKGANLYGRYLAHGSMQILTANNKQAVTPTTSAWQTAGFDWNRIPGTTSIHLPYDQLRARISNVDAFSGFEEMLYSDEAFAGGLSQQRNNGNFGMKLHEHDKYNGSHRARKSYHFFGGTIVCLGSDIENTNSEFPTETTIFQLATPNNTALNYWTKYKGDGNYWIDHLGTGYYVPGKTRLEKNFSQASVDEETDKPNAANWVSLIVDHGKAPKGASYAYAILPQINKKRLSTFAQKPSYKVLQHDRNAHIVRSLAKNTTSYVLFETPQTNLPGNLLLKADTSCLVMLRKEKSKLHLTVSQPDLALYRGASDEAFDKEGKRIERSIYSRPWIGNDSGEIPVTITLKGAWKMKDTPACKVIHADKKQTVIQFICKDAASYDVELIK
jgi:chondroitin-sulfate-ABC endolyase/exolyase